MSGKSAIAGGEGEGGFQHLMTKVLMVFHFCGPFPHISPLKSLALTSGQFIRNWFERNVLRCIEWLTKGSGKWECSKAGCQLCRTGRGRVRIFLAAKKIVFFSESANKGYCFIILQLG